MFCGATANNRKSGLSVGEHRRCHDHPQIHLASLRRVQRHDLDQRSAGFCNNERLAFCCLLNLLDES
jgi:hypothetical protein